MSWLNFLSRAFPAISVTTCVCFKKDFHYLFAKYQWVQFFSSGGFYLIFFPSFKSVSMIGRFSPCGAFFLFFRTHPVARWGVLTPTQWRRKVKQRGRGFIAFLGSCIIVRWARSIERQNEAKMTNFPRDQHKVWIPTAKPRSISLSSKIETNIVY